MAKAPTGFTKTFLDEANAGRKGKDRYTSLRDYYTDKGKFAAESKQFTARKTEFENKRGQSKRTQMVVSGQVIEEARKLYGSAADLYNVPELKTVFEKAFIEDYTPQDLLRAIDTTEWARARTDAQEKYDVLVAAKPEDARALVDSAVSSVTQALASKGVTADQTVIRQIAEKGVRSGWSQAQWAEYSPSEAMVATGAAPSTPAGAPAPAMPTATSLRTIAQQYGVRISDTVLNGYVKDIVSNRKTEDQFAEDMRVSAKTLYPTISDRLDTASFEQITAPYKRLYADILETSEDNVDLTNPSYSSLFSVGEAGKQRMMTATEWAGFLRKRPEWQNTQNAYKEYAQAADTLNKIFGGTR